MAFVALYALATMLLLPVEVLSVAAGAVFGPLAGVGLVWSGAMLGAAGGFWLGARISRPAVRALAGGRLEHLDAFLQGRGLFAVLIVRLVPLFPFALVNYVAGALSLRWRQFLVGTGLGIVPGTTAYVLLGGSATRLTSVPFLLAAGALLVLAFLAARRLHARLDRPAESDPSSSQESCAHTRAADKQWVAPPCARLRADPGRGVTDR